MQYVCIHPIHRHGHIILSIYLTPFFLFSDRVESKGLSPIDDVGLREVPPGLQYANGVDALGNPGRINQKHNVKQFNVF